MPRPGRTVPCATECVQDLREAENLVLRMRPVCAFAHEASSCHLRHLLNVRQRTERRGTSIEYRATGLAVAGHAVGALRWTR